MWEVFDNSVDGSDKPVDGLTRNEWVEAVLETFDGFNDDVEWSEEMDEIVSDINNECDALRREMERNDNAE